MALSLGSPPAAVSGCRILCCPDFPLVSGRLAIIQQADVSIIDEKYSYEYLIVQISVRILDIPRVNARWDLSHRSHGNEKY